MKADLQQVGQCHVISIDGAVMVDDVATLETMLQRLLTMGHYRIFIDLQQCTYIGSAGLSLLIRFANSCRRWNQGDLYLVAPPAYILSLLRLASLLSEERSFFQIVATLDQGLQILAEADDANPTNGSDTAAVDAAL